MKTVSQNELIYTHILAYGSITQKEAYDLYGCFRLASRICDLKRRGHNIGRVMEEGQNRFGEPERHARYFLTDNSTRWKP